MRRTRDKFACISLMDWGVSLGGEHFTADLSCGDEFSIEVKQEMTTGLAGRLNKKDETRSNRPGDLTTRFEGEESAIKASVEKARELWPFIKAVVVGSGSNPERVAWCIDKDIQRELNALHEHMQQFYKISCDPWSVDEGAVEAIYAQWDKLIAKLQ